MPISKIRPCADAIIVAAGNSSRMGKGINKQFLMIDGVPVLAHTLMRFEEAQSIANVIVVTKPESIVTVNDMVREFGISKIKAIVPGGNTRAESVVCGLKLVEDDRIVAVHDGARPFVTPHKIDELVALAKEHGAVAPGTIPKDTVKIIGHGNSVSDTPDRSLLRSIQTPQVFRAFFLKKAYATGIQSGFEGTDDCSYMENLGKPVYIAQGEYTNIKVTTPEDLPVAEALAKYLK